MDRRWPAEKRRALCAWRDIPFLEGDSPGNRRRLPDRRAGPGRRDELAAGWQSPGSHPPPAELENT